MACTILRFPPPASEYDRAYADLIDAYNAWSDAHKANERTLMALSNAVTLLAEARDRFDAARKTALANGEIAE